MKKRYIIGMKHDEKIGVIFLAPVPVDENNMGKQIMSFPEDDLGDVATIIGYANTGITHMEGEEGEPRDLGKIVNGGKESGTFAMDNKGNVERVGDTSDEELRRVFKNHQSSNADKDESDLKDYLSPTRNDALQKALAERFPAANDARVIAQKIADALKAEVDAGTITSTHMVDNSIAMMLGRVLANAKTMDARKRLLMIAEAGEVSYRLANGDHSALTLELMNRVLNNSGLN